MKRSWNLNQNTKLFIQENKYENIVYEITAILSRRRSSYRDFLNCLNKLINC